MKNVLCPAWFLCRKKEKKTHKIKEVNRFGDESDIQFQCEWRCLASWDHLMIVRTVMIVQNQTVKKMVQNWMMSVRAQHTWYARFGLCFAISNCVTHFIVYCMHSILFAFVIRFISQCMCVCFLPHDLTIFSIRCHNMIEFICIAFVCRHFLRKNFIMP